MRNTHASIADTAICLSLEQRGKSDYAAFLDKKSQAGASEGFAPTFMPEFLFDFQAELCDWAIRKGRAALFVETGLGKTAQQLVWAQNVVEKTNKPVLILTPLAVSFQTIREAEKFRIDAVRAHNGTFTGTRIVVTNYEQLSKFSPDDFSGTVCDESGVLKNFDSVTRKAVTEFMRKQPYRLLCTATPSPNDYIELGTSSEALGELGYMDMLTRFFKNDQNTSKPMRQRFQSGRGPVMDEASKWRFKGHAQLPFWRWVCSWARAVRKPSDLGFDDTRFLLPPLVEQEHLITDIRPSEDMLFTLPAVGLQEQRSERRRTIEDRCERVASLINCTGKPAIAWCHLNSEGDMLEKIIPDAVQVSGADKEEEKEEKLLAFVQGQSRIMISKPVVFGYGLNLQNCAHMTFFPSHSFSEYYQAVRRCYRFGQVNPVTVDIVTTPGEQGVLKNLKRKAAQADIMFDSLVRCMSEAQSVERESVFTKAVEVPSWL